MANSEAELLTERLRYLWVKSCGIRYKNARPAPMSQLTEVERKELAALGHLAEDGIRQGLEKGMLSIKREGNNVNGLETTTIES